MIEKPNEYKFADIKLSQKANFTVKITKSLVDSFATISGDYNSLHMDETYAKTTQFGKRVCHGMLLVSFFSRLVGMYLPGKNALYFSQTLNFTSPCFIDEEVTIGGEVLDKSESTRIITMKTTIHNQAGKCLVDGIAKVIVRV